MFTHTLDGLTAPRTARRAVAACCDTAGAGPVCRDSAELMTSEVVTNALIHGAGPVTLGVDCEGLRIRVEVGDDTPVPPVVGPPRRGGEGGRGMVIVQALAAAWGVDATTAGGKIVWFEVPVQP